MKTATRQLLAVSLVAVFASAAQAQMTAATPASASVRGETAMSKDPNADKMSGTSRSATKAEARAAARLPDSNKGETAMSKDPSSTSKMSNTTRADVKADTRANAKAPENQKGEAGVMPNDAASGSSMKSMKSKKMDSTK